MRSVPGEVIAGLPRKGLPGRSRKAPALFLLLLLPHAGCRGPEQARFEERTPLATAEPALLSDRECLVMASQPVEVDFFLMRGQRVSARFRADTRLLFNTHRHEGDRLILLHSGEGDAGEISFEAPHQGTFSFLWSLPPGVAADAKMKVQLVGQAMVERWIP